MDSIGRKILDHHGPLLGTVNPEGEVYFITICCVPRGGNQLANQPVWEAIDETLTLRQSSGDLGCRMALAMPDHLHALLTFNGKKDMNAVIGAMKSWLAKKHQVRWQRGFFDHRLRSWESAIEKGNYIRMNPVRAGLAASSDEWLYQR